MCCVFPTAGFYRLFTSLIQVADVGGFFEELDALAVENDAPMAMEVEGAPGDGPPRPVQDSVHRQCILTMQAFIEEASPSMNPPQLLALY